MRFLSLPSSSFTFTLNWNYFWIQPAHPVITLSSTSCCSSRKNTWHTIFQFLVHHNTLVKCGLMMVGLIINDNNDSNVKEDHHEPWKMTQIKRFIEGINYDLGTRQFNSQKRPKWGPYIRSLEEMCEEIPYALITRPRTSQNKPNWGPYIRPLAELLKEIKHL